MNQVLFLLLLLTFLSEGVAQNNNFNPAKNTSRKYKDNHGKMRSGSSSNCATCPEVFITNGGFEQVPFTFPGVEFFDESLIADWNTTASNNLIEIWRTGFNGVPAIEGEFFAELNATEAATLYLEVCTDPFSTINWSIWHRGRLGVDVAQVEFGPNLANLVPQSTLTTGLSWANYTGSMMFSRSSFNPNDLTQGWDGSFNGKELNPGVYVYYAKIKFFNGETKVVSGDVTLVK